MAVVRLLSSLNANQQEQVMDDESSGPETPPDSIPEVLESSGEGEEGVGDGQEAAPERDTLVPTITSGDKKGDNAHSQGSEAIEYPDICDEEGDECCGEMQGSPRSESESMMTCPICMDSIRHPVVTRCGHMLCFDCLMGLSNNTHHTKVHCPICRKSLNPAKDVTPIFMTGCQAGWDSEMSPEAEKFRKEFDEFIKQRNRRTARQHAVHVANGIHRHHGWDVQIMGPPGMSLAFGMFNFARAAYSLENNFIRNGVGTPDLFRRMHNRGPHNNQHDGNENNENVEAEETELQRRERLKQQRIQLIFRIFMYFMVALFYLMKPIIEMFMASRRDGSGGGSGSGNSRGNKH